MKFKIILFTAVLSALMFSNICYGQKYQTGDVDQDSLITANDASKVLSFVRNRDLISSELMFKIADVTGDNRITATDAAKVLKASKGSVSLPTIEYGEEPDIIATDFSLEGFAYGTTGGGQIEENSSAYAKVATAEEFGRALRDKAKVIEITNDIDLGYNKLSSTAKGMGVFSKNTSPLLHPTLIDTGVSKITLYSSDMTIFSKNGAKLTHVGFNLKNCSNIIIRNIIFDELWEWDEKTTGEYDRNDWDFITLNSCSNIWIDHCTFGKAYDGIVDSKGGSNKITISWCHFPSADLSENSFFMKQLNALEENKSSYPMYNYLRTNVGLSKEEIAKISAGQKKTHLVGSNSFEDGNADLEITLANNFYENSQDRMPRLRAGNAHVYNTIMDSSGNREINNITQERLLAKSSEMAKKGYNFGITSNGALSTEDGAVLVENCVMRGIVRPLADNQKDGSAKYTGKIKAINVLYELDSNVFIGGSDDINTPLVPNGSDVIKEFSWNGFTSLPYTYTTISPDKLEKTIKSKTGAGVVSIDWLANKYED